MKRALLLCSWLSFVTLTGCAEDDNLPQPPTERPSSQESATDVDQAQRTSELLGEIQRTSVRPDLGSLTRRPSDEQAPPVPTLNGLLQQMVAQKEALDVIGNQDQIDQLRQELKDAKDARHQLDIESRERDHEIELNLERYKVEEAESRRKEAEEEVKQLEEEQYTSKTSWRVRDRSPARITTYETNTSFFNRYGEPAPISRPSSTGVYLDTGPVYPVKTRIARVYEFR